MPPLVEAVKNTIANLSGKLEAMQGQIERQVLDLALARQGAEKSAVRRSGQVANWRQRSRRQ